MGRASRAKAEARARRAPSVIRPIIERVGGYEAAIACRVPGAWEALDGAVERGRRGEINWPRWCFLPVVASVQLATQAAISDGPHGDLNFARILSAIFAWRQGRSVWRFAPELAEAVIDTDLAERAIPVDVFYRLPVWCPYIAAPEVSSFPAWIKGFFAYLDWDPTNTTASLRLVLDVPLLGGLKPLRLPLSASTIVEALEVQGAEDRDNREKLGLAPKAAGELGAVAEVLGPLVSLALYVCSANAEIVDRAQPHRRPAKRRAPVAGEAAPVAYDVGYRISAALAAAKAQVASSGEGTGRQMAPGLRRSHWHTYWTGPKNGPVPQEAILKWLAPIPYGLGENSLVSVRKLA